MSGAELIGSTYTITFADGTTATGQLQGNNNQGGAQGQASQNSPALPVSLTVNGLGEGGVGTYNGSPTVVINGPAGETARVVLAKGFIQPGDNNFGEPFASQLDAQLNALAASDFPANNAVEFQTVDIVLNGFDQDISNQFDVSQLLNGESVAGGGWTDLLVDQLPLGFVASVIDPADGNLPTSGVTAPIYLQFTDELPADLELTKSVDNAAPVVGDQIIFTLTVDNAGTGDATGVQVEDLLPVGYTFVSATGDGTYDDNSGLWDIGTVANGDSASVDLTVVVEEVLTGPTVTPLFRINAGGPEVAATDGGPAWSEDQSAVNANNEAVIGTPSVYLVDRGIADDDETYGDNTPPGPGVNTTTAPDALFVTERFSTLSNPNNIGYAFDVANGDYQVDLFFDELFFTSAGSRIFDVEIEGVLELDDFDTAAVLGNDSGVQSFQTTVTDGQLNIEFLKTATNNPHVAAIQVSSVTNDLDDIAYNNYAQILSSNEVDPDSTPGDGSDGDDDDATVSVSPDNSADLELVKTASDATPAFGDTITFSLTVNHVSGPDTSGVSVQDLLADGYAFQNAAGDGTYDDATGVWTIGDLASGGSASLDITATVNAPVVPEPETILFRVNAGGAEVAAIDGGPNWTVDTNGTPSAYRVANGGGGNTFSGTSGAAHPGPINFAAFPALAALVPADVFNIERWDPASGNEMAWAFPIVAGTEVEVNLYFAELFSGVTAEDQRSFDVSVEGIVPTEFNDIDPFALAGPKGAIELSTTVTVDADGVLDLVFLHDVIENPALKGIEIVQLNDQTPIPLDYTNYAQILTSDRADSDSTPGDDSVGDDDDATIVVDATQDGQNDLSIVATADAAEPNSNGQFTVSLSEGASTDTIVDYTVTGTATPDGDYAALSGQVTIVQGDTSAVIDVSVLDDLELEGDESVSVTLDSFSGDANIAISASNSATVAIADDDVANEVTIEATLDGAEPNVDGQFTVSVGTPVAEDTTIDYTATGTATPNGDYTALAGQVTILQGQTSAVIDVSVLDDPDFEGDETVVVTLDAVAGGDANVRGRCD